MAVQQGDAQRLGPVLDRMGWCVLMYVLIHTAAWVAISQTDRQEDKFLESMMLGLDVLPIIGIPTLLTTRTPRPGPTSDPAASGICWLGAPGAVGWHSSRAPDAPLYSTSEGTLASSWRPVGSPG